jgi:hypothetical protein
MYRPNFCAECGARIERMRWRVWTSRHFCPNCAPQFRRGRITRPLAACLLLVGLGFGVGRALRPAPPPLVVAGGALPVPLADTRAAHTTQAAGSGAQPVLAYGPDGTAAERPTDPDEIISICGARTKKGTPCQRRVRGTGRCWQHLGKPAMLPPEKLIVQGHLPPAESK